MLLFVLSSMLAMGFGLTVAQIIAPLRNGRLVASSLLANFVLMPLAALAPPDCCGWTRRSAWGSSCWARRRRAVPADVDADRQGNLAFAVGLMVLLMVITVGYLSLVLPVLLPGVSVDPAEIARSLFLLMLLPLAGALVVNAKPGIRRAREGGVQPAV